MSDREIDLIELGDVDQDGAWPYPPPRPTLDPADQPATTRTGPTNRRPRTHRRVAIVGRL